MKKQFRSFEDARKFVQSLGLKNTQEWRKYYKSNKMPENIPSTPMRTYKKDWKSMGDWLGTGYVANQNRNYQSFEDARKFVQSLQLNYFKDWRSFCKSGKKPENIPNAPHKVYENEGWTSWGDFLGTGNIGNQNKIFRSFLDAKKFVRKLKISSQTEWVNKYCKSGNKPNDIPSNVQNTYKKEWTSWGDFLGTGNIRPKDRKFMDFDRARKFIRKLKFKNRDDWKEFVKSREFPLDIPKDPSVSYRKKGWTSWGDFLGTGVIANQNRVHRPFEDAQKFVQSLGLKNQKEWREYSKSNRLPIDIPANPESVYKNKGWTSWGDFLGTGRIANQTTSKKYLSLDEGRKKARELAKKYNIKTWNDWNKAVKEGKIPDNIPMQPDRVYSKKRKK